MYRITVPATTANIGPGFDAMGLALNLYLTVEVKSLGETIHKVVWSDPNTEPLPDEDNLILVALQKTLDRLNLNKTGFELKICKCEIPVSRGLGSSASAIVAGILAANALSGEPMSHKDIVDWATELEGHPDNVVPALDGGMSISILADQNVYTTPIPVPKALGFAVMIPDFELSTASARKVLPDHYSKKDCIHNLSRAAYLVASFNNNCLDGLREALNDKIHQPYRIGLIDEGNDVLKAAEVNGAVGEFISGAGPTLIALYDKSDTHFISLMKEKLDQFKNKWTLLDLTVCNEGAHVEVIE